MPRKVLITKDTLEKILANYQGGGSGGGVSVESNIIDVKFTSAEGILHFYFWKEKWNEFLQSKSLTEQQFLDGFNNANSKLELFTFFNQLFSPLSKLVGVLSFYQSVQVYDGDNNEFYSEKPLVYIEPYIDDLDNPTHFTLTVYCLYGIHGTGGNSNAATDKFMLLGSEYDATFTASISTLDLVNVTGGQGGGTVEAEPIVSINMTNVDGRDIDANPPEICNLQFYCTKERWDNFVTLANSEFQTQITYQNFDTVFKALDRQRQTFVLGYLMMDYYEGKVLPDAFAYEQQENNGIVVRNTHKSIHSELVKGTLTNNIEVVMTAYFDGFCAIPNGESVSGTYTTANTVITVEEIAGASIGASGGDTPSQSESTGMQIWEFTFGVDVSIQVYTKFTQSDLSTMLTDTNTSIDTINTMMGISLNHISSFNDIGTLITQSQTIDSTGALTETLIATFMSGLCSGKKTINVLQSDMFVRRTVVNCYPTINNQMATNYNCVVINNQNQFVTIQIDGTNAGARYEEI